MNLLNSKELVLKYIDEYSTDGVPISEGENKDYLLKHNLFADKVQKELAREFKIPAVHSISLNPIPNQLGLLAGYEVIQHLNEDVVISALASKSYYFEVDNVSTIYIEEKVSGAWTVKATINNTVKNKFTSYKGLINSGNDEVRIRFSGQYPYSIRNTALYAYTFPSVSDVPNYIPYVPYEMPSDFMELDNVIQKTEPREYKSAIDYKWEKKKTFLVNYHYKGSFDIHYFRYPTNITNSTPDTYEYEVPGEVEHLIPIKVAALMIMGEKSDVATLLLNLFEAEKKNTTPMKDPSSPRSVQVVWGD